MRTCERRRRRPCQSVARCKYASAVEEEPRVTYRRVGDPKLAVENDAEGDHGCPKQVNLLLRQDGLDHGTHTTASIMCAWGWRWQRIWASGDIHH
jgi:hypothetical protein